MSLSSLYIPASVKKAWLKTQTAKLVSFNSYSSHRPDDRHGLSEANEGPEEQTVPNLSAFPMRAHTYRAFANKALTSGRRSPVGKIRAFPFGFSVGRLCGLGLKDL